MRSVTETTQPDRVPTSSSELIEPWTILSAHIAEAMLIVAGDSVLHANRKFVEWFGLQPDATQWGARLAILRDHLSPCFADPRIFGEKWRGVSNGADGKSPELWEIAF